MRVLIIGASSLVAKYLYQSTPCDVTCTYHMYCPCPAVHMDVTNPNGMENVFKTYNPDVVIMCAAEGDVDTVENEYQKCNDSNPVIVGRFDEDFKRDDVILKTTKSYQVNVDGVKNVVSMCRDHSAKLVFLSTNAVFYGDQAPYSEKDERKAINKYGEIKILAENEAIQCPEWLIIRPILLYGNPWINGRTNFVTRTVQRLKAEETIKVVNDTLTQPTYVGDLAKAIWNLIMYERAQTIVQWEDGEKTVRREIGDRKTISNQIVHIASPETVTLFDFALKIASVYNLDDRLIEPVPSDYFKTIAPRPKDTTYDLTKMTNLSIECSGACEGLQEMKDEQ